MMVESIIPVSMIWHCQSYGTMLCGVWRDHTVFLRMTHHVISAGNLLLPRTH